MEPVPDRPTWTFLTNYARVLIAILRNPDLRQSDIAQAVGITVGAAQRIIKELERDGYLVHERIGRRNRYFVNTTLPLRHPLVDSRTVSDLFNALET